jgi:hypothetical protein
LLQHQQHVLLWQPYSIDYKPFQLTWRGTGNRGHVRQTVKHVSSLPQAQRHCDLLIDISTAGYACSHIYMLPPQT